MDKQRSPPAEIAKLFERFYRVDKKVAQEHEVEPVWD